MNKNHNSKLSLLPFSTLMSRSIAQRAPYCRHVFLTGSKSSNQGLRPGCS